MPLPVAAEPGLRRKSIVSGAYRQILLNLLSNAHGGQLHIDSREGAGTTISVELPFVYGQRIAA